MPHHAKFTATKVAALVKTAKPGWYGDGGGLWLQVTPTGTASWIFRYRAPADGRPRVMGLGPIHTVSLAEARDAATLARKAVFTSQDPAGVRAVERVTFDQCVRECLAAREDSKHAITGWQSILTRYATPAIGTMSVAAITTDDVLRMLTPLWTTKTETANKLRRYTETVLKYATVIKKVRTGDNPAAWSVLGVALQSPKKVSAVKSHAAMEPEELPEFMRELAAVDLPGARALEVLILTVSRAGDITGQPVKTNQAAKPPMRWADIDLARRLWVIPDPKGGVDDKHKNFQVPLSDAVVAILRGLPREGERVFDGMGKTAMWDVSKTLRPDLTIHGFRSTFSAWAKNGGKRHEWVEATLKHVVHQTAVEGAYSEHVTYLPGRTQLMQAWADYATGAEVPTVVHLRAPRG